MEPLEKKSFNTPDEIKTPAPKVRSEWVHMMGKTLRRVTLEPGWKFKEHSGPARGTELCEEFHVKLFFGGRFVASYADGTQEEVAAEVGVSHETVRQVVRRARGTRVEQEVAR